MARACKRLYASPKQWAYGIHTRHARARLSTANRRRRLHALRHLCHRQIQKGHNGFSRSRRRAQAAQQVPLDRLNLEPELSRYAFQARHQNRRRFARPCRRAVCASASALKRTGFIAWPPAISGRRSSRSAPEEPVRQKYDSRRCRERHHAAAVSDQAIAPSAAGDARRARTKR